MCPVRGATIISGWFHRVRCFNPRAPCGARLSFLHLGILLYMFQSTRPVWGATHVRAAGSSLLRVSIHAPRVGRDFSPPFFYVVIVVSIHAPRVGRDRTIKRRHQLHESFNPRAPCGARPVQSSMCGFCCMFQSTRPVRGATCVDFVLIHTMSFQSTRPVWGATSFVQNVFTGNWVSIHAPRVGRDYILCCFLYYICVSIHAPRVGRDRGSYRLPLPQSRFNPRAPCGARHADIYIVNRDVVFQSTRPVWGATRRSCVQSSQTCVSIHAPRVGRD